MFTKLNKNALNDNFLLFRNFRPENIHTNAQRSQISVKNLAKIAGVRDEWHDDDKKRWMPDRIMHIRQGRI